MIYRALSSVAERYTHIVEATGPNPVVPTMQKLELIAVILLLLIAAVYVFYQVWPNLLPEINALQTIK